MQQASPPTSPASSADLPEQDSSTLSALDRFVLFLQGKTRRNFRLAGYFSIASLITIITAALLVSWMYHQLAVEDLKHQAKSNNVALTQAFSNAIWSQLQYFINEDASDLSKGRVESGNTLHLKTLSDSIAQLIRHTPVQKIEIYDLRGRTVYSSDEDKIGESAPPDSPGAIAARRGTITVRINHHDFYRSINGVVQDRWIMQSYLPLHNPLNGEIAGAFEVSSDVTDTYQRITDSRNRFALMAVGIFGGVYLILFIMVYHADRVIRYQAEERERYLQRIKQVNSSLDRTARELAIAHDEAVNANNSKSQFMANMSHELRTPLNAIIGYSEMLVEDLEPRNETALIDDLKKIQNAGRHLLGIINEILDLSKIEAGRIELHLETFDINDIVHGVADTLQPLAIKNDNRFDVSCDVSIGSMRSDITRLRQILFNLLSNSFKFTHRGRILLQVVREGAADNGYLLFIVEDTGIGINPQQLKHIFEPFRQADSSTTREYGGTGLGLTISKRFCEILGGSILVESTPGKGARFIVKLPAITPEYEPSQLERPRLSGPLASQFSPGMLDEERRKRSGHVLIIGHQGDASLQDILISRHFDVQFITSPSDLPSLATGHTPQLIIMDASMALHPSWHQSLCSIALDKLPRIILADDPQQIPVNVATTQDVLARPIDAELMVAAIRKRLRSPLITTETVQPPGQP